MLTRQAKHVFLDHLPFWFIVFCAISYMAFDVWAMATESWIYAPDETINE